MYGFVKEAQKAFDVKTSLVKVDDYDFLKQHDISHIVPWIMPTGKNQGSAKYRTKDELNSYKEKDPVKMTESKILENKIASKEEIDEIKAKIKQEITEASKFAEESDYPPASALYEHNYVQKDYPFIKD